MLIASLKPSGDRKHECTVLQRHCILVAAKYNAIQYDSAKERLAAFRHEIAKAGTILQVDGEVVTFDDDDNLMIGIDQPDVSAILVITNQ